jgi:hypothetical protein
MTYSDNVLSLDDSRDSWSLLNNMSGPAQHSALTDDAMQSDALCQAYQAATAMRDSLATDLHRWTLLERKLRRAGREIAAHNKSLFERCNGLIARFDSLAPHEVCGTPEFSSKFASHSKDLERVLELLTEDCQEYHITPDPPAPPLPPRALAPAVAECAAAPPPTTHNVGTVVAPPRPAPQSDGSDTGAASSVHSVPLIETAIRELSHCCDSPERFWGLLVAMRDPERNLERFKDRQCLLPQERWSYFTSWSVIYLSKKQPREVQRCYTKTIVSAFESVQHSATVCFSPENYLSNNKVPPIAMLREAARLFRDGNVLNLQASDADKYQRIDNRGLNRGLKRGGGQKMEESIYTADSGTESAAERHGGRGERKRTRNTSAAADAAGGGDGSGGGGGDGSGGALRSRRGGAAEGVATDLASDLI